MRIIVTGGGTGGHAFPALEIVKELRRQNEKIDVLFVGNSNSFEEKLAKNAGIPFIGLSAKKVVGQSLFGKLIALAYLKIAVLKSLWLMLKKRPAAVIGVGGYVSAPIVIASFMLGIRRYICEQNVVPGLANKSLALIAKRVFISFKESAEFFPQSKSVHTGNPVRKEFFLIPEKKPEHGLKVLVTGGSLGASFLNLEVPKVMQKLASHCPNLMVTHQTGQTNKDEILGLYQQAGIEALVLPFIDNMPQAFKHHDLLISRAGATVCAEIMAAGMPSILVPYPFANGHQKNNALALERMNAAIMVEEGESFKDCLAEKLKTLYSEPALRHEIARNAKSMGTKSAASVIVNSVLHDL